MKMDAADQLLLSEGVCRQLGIMSYHPSVWTKKSSRKNTNAAIVPLVMVSLVRSLKLAPNQCSLVEVRVEGAQELGRALMVEQEEELVGVMVEDSIVSCSKEGYAHVLLINQSDTTVRVPVGTQVGHAEPVDVVTTQQSQEELPDCATREVTCEKEEWRKKKLLDAVKLPELPSSEKELLLSLHGRR